MGRELTGWALDLDGVIWRGSETVPGAPAAVARLRSAGVPIAFVTNSAQRTPAQVADKLASHGIPDAESEVITAAVAATTMVDRAIAFWPSAPTVFSRRFAPEAAPWCTTGPLTP